MDIENLPHWNEVNRDDLIDYPSPVRKKICLQEIKDTIEILGVWAPNKSALSRKYNFNRESIRVWTELIIKNIKFEDLHTVTVDFISSYKRITSQQKRILASQDSTASEKQEASRIILLAFEKYTDFLERYGYKEKIAEKHTVEVTETIRKQELLIRADMEEMKDLPEEKKKAVRRILLGEHEDL